MQRICWLCIVVQFMVVNEWNIVLNHWLAQGVHQYIYTIRPIPCHVHIHSFNNVVRLPNSNMGRLKETPFCEVLFHRWSSFRLLVLPSFLIRRLGIFVRNSNCLDEWVSLLSIIYCDSRSLPLRRQKIQASHMNIIICWQSAL